MQMCFGFQRGYWNDKNNHRKFLDALGRKLGTKGMHDWYDVSIQQIVGNGGGVLFNRYGNSIPNLITSVYSEHTWIVSRFGSSLEYQRNFLDGLGNQLGFKHMEDWYNITAKDIRERGGESLLKNQYDGSIFKLVSSVFKEHFWISWKFRNMDLGLDQNQRFKFVEWLRKELKIRNFNDWYRVSQNQIQKIAPLRILKQNPLEQLLQTVYPNHTWEIPKLRSKLGIKASERMLAAVVGEIFPNSGKKNSFIITILTM